MDSLNTPKQEHIDINDIQPSSFIGEQVLGGMSTKLLSVRSISECDLMVIDAAEKFHQCIRRKNFIR